MPDNGDSFLKAILQSTMSEKHIGLPPVYDEKSRILILGSFPSVKSRASCFYYANPQNRFWKMLFDYFEEPFSDSIPDRLFFLHKHGIALWDVVTECMVKGSSDASIREYQTADILNLLQKTNISLILLNGLTAYKIFSEQFGTDRLPCRAMPSTSPANRFFDVNIWYAAFDTIYKENGNTKEEIQ